MLKSKRFGLLSHHSSNPTKKNQNGGKMKQKWRRVKKIELIKTQGEQSKITMRNVTYNSDIDLKCVTLDQITYYKNLRLSEMYGNYDVAR